MLTRQAHYVFYALVAGFVFFGIRNMLGFTIDRGLGMLLGIMLALMETAPIFGDEGLEK